LRVESRGYRAMRNRKPRTAKLLIMMGIFVVLVGGVLAWYRATNTLPLVHIPTRKMPVPNGYDYYLKAAGMMVNEKAIKAIWEGPPGPPPPGLILRGTKPPTPHPPPTEKFKVYSLAEKESIVRQNTEALRTLRRGFSFQSMCPWTLSGEDCPHAYPDFRRLRQLLLLEAEVKAARGDRNGAMKSCLDAVEFGTNTPRGGTIIDLLSGKAAQSTGRRRAWALMYGLNTSEARKAARRMADLSARQVAFADALRWEKWSTQVFLMKIMRRSDWRAELEYQYGYPRPWSALKGIMGDVGFPPSLKLALKSMFLGKRGIIRAYSEEMDKLITESRRPYPAGSPSEPYLDDPFLYSLTISNNSTRFGWVTNETQNNLLAVALALRAYQLERGEYPERLDALVPKCLTTIPGDPFSTHKPLRYKRTGSKYLLYSIGPDGRDNGGKVIYKPKETTRRIRYYVYPNSKGDIVAGINIY